MSEIINAVKDTPIPTILVFAGLFFILLSFVSKLGSFVEVRADQQKWAAPIGIFLLVLGLVLSFHSPQKISEKSIPSPSISPQIKPQAEVPTSPSKNDCSDFFKQGKVLNWKIRKYGKLGNIGTLEINSVNSLTGEWIGDQITETKDDIKIRVTGTINGSTMSLLHHNGVEKWLGNCGDTKIEGSIETTYNSQLTFEMQ